MTKTNMVMRAEDAVKLARRQIKSPHEFKEHFIAIFLNARNKPIKTEIVSMGCMTSSLIHPRELMWSAIVNRAAFIVVLHNHPSCETAASEADLALTERLKQVGELMGIEIIDHIIFTLDGQYQSCMF